VLLNHLAAILLFAGPFFYIGLWMALDPSGLARLLALPLQRFVGDEHGPMSRRLRSSVRGVGVLLVLFAIVV
jgi:hypothetical protein